MLYALRSNQGAILLTVRLAAVKPCSRVRWSPGLSPTKPRSAADQPQPNPDRTAARNSIPGRRNPSRYRPHRNRPFAKWTPLRQFFAGQDHAGYYRRRQVAGRRRAVRVNPLTTQLPSRRCLLDHLATDRLTRARRAHPQSAPVRRPPFGTRSAASARTPLSRSLYRSSHELRRPRRSSLRARSRRVDLALIGLHPPRLNHIWDLCPVLTYSRRVEWVDEKMTYRIILDEEDSRV